VKEAVITGVYNELGYVVRKNGIAIHAVGNSPYESETYVKAEDGMGVDQMAEYCADTIKKMVENPSLWESLLEKSKVDQSTTLKNGGTKYSKSLKPRDVAAQTGDLPY